MSRVRLSPDGLHAATIVADQGFNGLIIVDLKNGSMHGQKGKRTFNPYWVDWLSNHDIVLSASVRDHGNSRIFVAALDDLRNPKSVHNA